jgi:hypothetical protein
MKNQPNNSILRVNNPTQKEFLKLWKQHQPFVIGGVAEHWDAYKNWSNDYLLKICGDKSIRVESYKQGFLEDHKYAYKDNYHPKEIKFKDYIDIVSGNKKDHDVEYYMAQVDFENHFPELIKDISYPQYFSRKALINFWFGFSSKTFDSTTALHFDREHNIFAQIRGRKRILLFIYHSIHLLRIVLLLQIIVR